MLDPFLKSDLMVCAQTGNLAEVINHFPEFSRVLYTFCSLPGSYVQKSFVLITLENMLGLLAEKYGEMCASCQKQLIHIVDFVKEARLNLLKEEPETDPTVCPVEIIALLSWHGSRIQLCEKIYGDYVMGLTGARGKAVATLGALVEAYNALYGTNLTEDECTDAMQKMKSRKGKNYPDFRDKIPVRGYHAYDTHMRLEEYMIEQDGTGDGRKQPRPKPSV